MLFSGYPMADLSRNFFGFWQVGWLQLMQLQNQFAGAQLHVEHAWSTPAAVCSRMSLLILVIIRPSNLCIRLILLIHDKLGFRYPKTKTMLWHLNCVNFGIKSLKNTLLFISGKNKYNLNEFVLAPMMQTSWKIQTKWYRVLYILSMKIGWYALEMSIVILCCFGCMH